jgi:drug/metabolite transporter (DMT)-like permease
MRLSLVAGVLLIVGGVVVMARGFAYTSQRSVLKVGDFEATLEEKRAVSPWFGAGAIVLGLVIILAGERRRGTG